MRLWCLAAKARRARLFGWSQLLWRAWSNDVVFAAWCEDVDDERVFHSRSAVFDSATDHETVAGSNFEGLSLTSDFQMPANDVDNLIVKMAVYRAHPISDHLVLGDKEFVVVGHHLARQAAFRFFLLCRLRCPPESTLFPYSSLFRL